MLLHFIKLVRWPNLLIVFLTQWIVWSQLMCKSLRQLGIASNLSFFQFCLLSFSTMLVAAAGYVINDIEDVKIDLINKPDKVVVGTRLTAGLCYTFYYCLLLIGFTIALFLAWQLDKFPFVMLYPLFAVLLHLYATHLKQTPLLGNILISLFVAAVPMLIFLADASELFIYANERVLHILLLYGSLAFLANLAREVIKDMQDVKGDRAYGAKTFPILFGLKNSKYLVMFSLLTIIAILMYWTFVWDIDQQSRWSIGAGTVPLLLICFGLITQLPKLESAAEFGRWSLGIKIFMLFGLLFLYLQPI